MLEFIARKIRGIYEYESSSIYDIHAMELLRPFAVDYLPWTRSAVRPISIVNIMNDIIINGRKNIVELGSGISTYFIAKAISLHGGRLLSFDSDANWIETVGRMTSDSESVSLFHAPLKPCKYAKGGALWFDENIIYTKIGDIKIDLLFVDAPAAYSRGKKFARFPAVPLLKDHLSPSFVVYLDDVNRRAEQEILHEWARILGVPPQMDLRRSKTGRLTKGPALNSSL